MAKINVLSDEISALIAAGEVVISPAAAIKELVENSLDALSTDISISIVGGGLAEIVVKDNGEGIEKSEISKVFIKHATSKISCREDVFNIGTLGFRGEALASILAVADVELETKHEADKIGTRVVYENSKKVLEEDSPIEKGTIITVKRLFYSTPARYKFNSDEKKYTKEVLSLIKQFILANPSVHFTLFIDGEEKLSHSSGTVESAIECVYGTTFLDYAVPINSKFGSFTLTGYACTPELSKANKTWQAFFVNNRIIDISTMGNFITAAYDTFLLSNRYPCAVLYLNGQNSDIDINISPQKSLVRLDNNDATFNFIKDAITSAVVMHITKNARNIGSSSKQNFTFSENLDSRVENLFNEFNERTRGANTNFKEIVVNVSQKDKLKNIENSKVDFDNEKQECNSEVKGQTIQTKVQNQEKKASKDNDDIISYDKQLSSFAPNTCLKSDSPIMKEVKNRINSDELLADGIFGKYDESLSKDFSEDIEITLNGYKKVGKSKKEINENKYQDVFVTFDREKAKKEQQEMDRKIREQFEKDLDNFKKTRLGIKKVEEQTFLDKPYKIIGTLFNTYILFEAEDDMYLLDQHAVHERYLFDKFMEEAENKSVVSQDLLVPYHFGVSIEEREFLMENKSLLKDMGIEVEEFGKTDIVITSVPTYLTDCNLGELLIELLLDLNKLKRKSELIKDKIATRACKSAIKAGFKLNDEQLNKVVEMVLNSKTPPVCPHGRPYSVKI